LTSESHPFLNSTEKKFWGNLIKIKKGGYGSFVIKGILDQISRKDVPANDKITTHGSPYFSRRGGSCRIERQYISWVEEDLGGEEGRILKRSEMTYLENSDLVLVGRKRPRGESDTINLRGSYHMQTLLGWF